MSANHSLTVLCCFFTASMTGAYTENCMPDLPVPTQLEAGGLEAAVQHRFYRTPGADFPDNFINMANVKLGLRYVPLPKFEVGTTYDILFKEYDFHAGYSVFLPKIFLRAQALAEFYGAKRDFSDTWDHSLLSQINLQGEPLAGVVLPVADFAYDGLTRKFGIGTGIDLAVRENIDLLGEYYPVLGDRTSILPGEKAVNCFAAAVKISTLGHHFVFTVSNNNELGMRRHIRGAPNNTIYYGFNIHRLFSF